MKTLQDYIEQVEREFVKDFPSHGKSTVDVLDFLRTKIREAVEAAIEETRVSKYYDTPGGFNEDMAHCFDRAVSLQQQKARTFLGGDKE